MSPTVLAIKFGFLTGNNANQRTTKPHIDQHCPPNTHDCKLTPSQTPHQWWRSGCVLFLQVWLMDKPSMTCIKSFVHLIVCCCPFISFPLCQTPTSRHTSHLIAGEKKLAFVARDKALRMEVRSTLPMLRSQTQYKSSYCISVVLFSSAGDY